MNGYIKETNRGGVYNRLYLDSTVRKKKQENLNKDTLVDSVFKPRIENVLMQKHAFSQAKISTLRAKQQIKEIQELKRVPSINKISKEIVDAKKGNFNGTVSNYASRLLAGSKLSEKIIPKQSFLSLLDLEKEDFLKNGLNFESFSEQKTINSKDQSFIKDLVIKKNLKNQVFSEESLNNCKNSKNEELQKLRKAVVDRCKIFEIEKPVEILKMSVVDRNTHWLSEKNMKLQQKMNQKTAKETLGCTFSPELTPRIQILQKNLQKHQINNSYSSKHSEKPVFNLSLSKKPAKQEVCVQKKPSFLYQSLSPHQRFISRSHTSLLTNSKPMVSYKIN